MPNYAPDPDKQPELLSEERSSDLTTPEEQIQKDVYSQRLRAYLRDPEFRKKEGFPIGEDEEILALSDPPYYTACPNPFLGEIIKKWQKERVELRKELGLPDDSLDNGNGLKVYHREPFASDVSEGKNDPIYNAHSYHTKVPHKAVMRYILHYTDPGDIVLDGFCGTGMTGVAAQLCSDKQTVESLGYTVQYNGTVLDENGETISKLGARKAVLVDLSPAATFIAYNYNTPADKFAFEKEAHRILKKVEKEYGWMYETWHPNDEDANRVKAKINFTVWSDVFVCPNCGTEINYWDIAVDRQEMKILDSWNCPNCSTLLAKSPKKSSSAIKIERGTETIFDRALGITIHRAKQVPVLINYGSGKNRNWKRPDAAVSGLITRIGEEIRSADLPVKRMPEGDESRRNDDMGITHLHHYFTWRNLIVFSTMWREINTCNDKRTQDAFIFALTAATRYLTRLSKLGTNYYFHGGGGVINAGLLGTYYIPSFSAENNVIRTMQIRIPKLIKVIRHTPSLNHLAIATQSASEMHISIKNKIDYLFVDPPFGSNLMYSELNFLWEPWLKVITNNNNEAVVNKTQRKGLPEYQQIMENCFQQFFKALKPGRWMTVEFHNSQSSVWNAIQEAILRAGFIVADIRTLDKQQGSFKQVNTTAAVKQDLIISAYKPRAAFELQFLAEGGSIKGAWAFLYQHLDQLPIPAVIHNMVETLAERQNYLLYDRMVAFHIMRGLAVPLSAAEFYQGLYQRFIPRDGMYFTPEQAAEYDKRRLGAQQVEQLTLFVTDEKSAIQWLRRELDPATGVGPQTYQDLMPNFLRELHQARYEALPELRTMLEDNFLLDEGGHWYVPNPEKQADKDALRQKSLLREFSEYLKSKGRLKVFRSEAVRAGFSHYWKERDYDTILKVADRLPSNVLEEDQQLLMYVHNAALRHSQQPKQERLL